MPSRIAVEAGPMLSLDEDEAMLSYSLNRE